MATPTLFVLLRNGTHAAASLRYALKAESWALQGSKTPIQIPIPQENPELIDLGIVRPSLTISGIVDSRGESTSENTTDFQTMSSFSWNSQTYYIPYKNKLEDFCSDTIFSTATPLELQLGDNTTPIATDGPVASTGGGLYQVAMQQYRFEIKPGAEDRWEFTMTFVARNRSV